MTRAERGEVDASLRAARAGTRARVELVVTEDADVDAMAHAQRHFAQRGLHQHEGGAVLLFVAPNAHRVAVWGDRAAHRAVGERYWVALIDDITGHFAHGSLGGGIAYGLDKIGAMLHEHFPKATH